MMQNSVVPVAVGVISLRVRSNLKWVNGNLKAFAGKLWNLDIGSDNSPEVFCM